MPQQFEAVAALDVDAANPFQHGSGPLLPNRARRIEGLRITFQVKMDGLKQMNSADITVYNLSEASRNAIRGQPATGTRGTGITLWVGYGQGSGLQVLFRGFASEVNHSLDPPDVKTRIQVNAESAADLTKPATLSFVEGVSAHKVLQEVLATIGSPVEFLAQVTDKPYLQGFAFSGRARDALDQVTRRLGLQWSNQNGKIRILTPGGSTGKRTPLLSPETGMVGSPERIWRPLDEPESATKPPGWKVKCLLQPQILPGDLVALRSREIDPAAAFPVLNVQHDGDTHGDAWTTTFECTDEGKRGVVV